MLRIRDSFKRTPEWEAACRQAFPAVGRLADDVERLAAEIDRRIEDPAFWAELDHPANPLTRERFILVADHLAGRLAGFIAQLRGGRDV